MSDSAQESVVSRPALKQRASQIAHTVANRLADPDRVAALSTPAMTAADQASLHVGHAGIALLYARLAALDTSWTDVAHAHCLRAANRSPAGAAAGVFDAPGSVIMAAATAATHDPNTGRWADLLTSGRQWLARRMDTVLASGLSSPSHYDVVSGLAGLIRAHLATRGPHTASLLRAVGALTQTAPDVCDPTCQPHLPLTPGRGIDTGMAHGAAGVLAILAIAALHDIDVPGHQTAISGYVGWLLHHARRRRNGWVWPTHVDPHSTPSDAIAADSRQNAWCYGTAGIARALFLAGQVQHDASLRATAAMFLTTNTPPSHDPTLADSTVCHGQAGLLQAITRTAANRPDRDLAQAADRSAARVLAEWDPDHRFGFTHRERDRCIDVPGILVGGAGVAAALLDYAEGSPPSDIPSWDMPLLLS